MELPKIEKGIPVPERANRLSSKSAYARSMESGDSFEVTKQESISWRGILWNPEFKKKFMGRSMDNGNVRFWKL